MKGNLLIKTLPFFLLILAFILFFNCKKKKELSDSVTAVIGPDGGTIVSTDEKLTLEIPPGALSTKLTITVKTSSENLGQCGNLYRITFSEEEEFTFLKPVAIRIKYVSDSLPEDAKEENLRIGLLGPMDCWELLSNSIVDKTNRVVNATTDHFSGVGLLYVISTTGPIKLAFPLPNRVPYGDDTNSVVVNTIFDHSMSSPYTADSIVEAFNGEKGTVKSRYVTTVKKGHPLHGYRKPDGSVFFSNNEIKYSGYDTLFYDGHPGYDFRTRDQNPSGNIPVLAAADGIVKVVDTDWGGVRIQHPNGYFTKYLHLLPQSIKVKVGDTVLKGQEIGISGGTGPDPNGRPDPNKYGPHLHFEVLNGSYKPIDPYKENLWEAPAGNNPPNTPQTPSGLSSGQVNVSYNFTTSTTDPDGDSVAYQFDWGDGNQSNWSSFLPSGTSITMAKSWSNAGTYSIKARAKDKKGAISGWSDGHQITITGGGGAGWTRTFGSSNRDEGWSVQQTSDGGYIIAGYTESFGAGNGDVYLIKTDGNGNLQWQRTFGGSNSDGGWSVQQTSDGGYIIAGSTSSFGAGNGDVYLIKTDGNGNLQWQRTFGGSNSDGGWSVQQTSDGGYIIAGSTSSFGAGNGDVYLIKTDGNGNLQWQRTFGGSNSDCGYSVRQTTDGGYIIVGWKDYWDKVYLVKTDGIGNLQWEKTIRYYSIYNGGLSVQQTTDGGYIIVGGTASFITDWDVFLIKADANGNSQWQKTFGGYSKDAGWDVWQTSDHGYIISGETRSYGMGGIDIYLIKTDADGNLQWQKTFGGSNNESWDNKVQQTQDGGYIIAGFTESFGAGERDVYLIKTNASGDTMRTFSFKPNRNYPNRPESDPLAIPTNPGGMPDNPPQVERR